MECPSCVNRQIAVGCEPEIGTVTTEIVPVIYAKSNTAALNCVALAKFATLKLKPAMVFQRTR